MSSALFEQFSEQPNGVTFVNSTAEDLVLWAFSAQQLRTVGLPGWATRERFDVIARSETMPLNGEEKRQRMQTLLAERFALRVHRDPREQPIYELTVVRAGFGPGLRRRDCATGSGRPPAVTDCGRGIAPLDAGLVRMFGVAIPWLAAGPLSAAAGRVVVDRTNVEGQYDVDLRYRPDAGISPELTDEARREIETRAALFAAVEEQLGLRLQPARGAVEMLIVDAISRPNVE